MHYNGRYLPFFLHRIYFSKKTTNITVADLHGKKKVPKCHKLNLSVTKNSCTLTYVYIYNVSKLVHVTYRHFSFSNLRAMKY